MIHWRKLTLAERQLAFVWGGLALAVVTLEPLLPLAASHLRPCLLREVTGVPCPTCGATRGLLALLDGRVLDALALNPLVAVVGLAFLVGGIVAPLWAWRRGTGPQLTGLPLWLRLVAVGLILANWAWVLVRTV
jgi:hypothetical protein